MTSSRPRTSLVLIAFLAFVSLGLPDGVLGVAWPSIRAAFGLPVSQMGSLLAAGTCGYLLAGFFSGQIVRRLGVGRLLLVSSWIVVFASTGYALTPAWPLMVLLGACSGLGAGAIDSGINAYAAHHFSPRVVNWLHAFYGVGATLGPLLMTGVLSAGLVWRWGYALNAALLALMSLCFLLTIKLWDSPRDAPERRGDNPHPPVNETLSRPVVWLSVVLFFLYTGLEVATGQWTYSLFTQSRHVAPAVVGAWVGVYWACLTVGRVLFGFVAGRFAPLMLLRITMLTAPLGAALIWANVSQAASFAGLALMGFCFAPMFPLLISLTPGRVGRNVAHRVIGFEVAAACVGAAGVGGATGILARRFGLEVIGPVLFVVAVLLLVMHELVHYASRSPDVAVSPAAPEVAVFR
jgi:fucose permease